MENKELRVGVVGYCPPTKFDENKALEYIRDAYNRVIADFPEHEITIVSGVTNVGVLKLVYEEAKRRNWRTARVSCKKAYDFEWFPTDEEPVIVGENWGDESQKFLDSIDTLVRVGGGKQALREIAEMKKRGKQVVEYDLPKKK